MATDDIRTMPDKIKSAADALDLLAGWLEKTNDIVISHLFASKLIETDSFIHDTMCTCRGDGPGDLRMWATWLREHPGINDQLTQMSSLIRVPNHTTPRGIKDYD